MCHLLREMCMSDMRRLCCDSAEHAANSGMRKRQGLALGFPCTNPNGFTAASCGESSAVVALSEWANAPRADVVVVALETSS
mmetsp:Transcript_106448/g.211466  ORF Transcript_106448/g.211466 Transcript_106448/m.211466 type:complete len:82 (+) Transcript_106448:481-726(+)